MSKVDWSNQESVSQRLLMEMGTLYNTWMEDFRDKMVPLQVGRESLMHATTFFNAAILSDLNPGMTPEQVDTAVQRFRDALTYHNKES